jgi:hypothetical protein
VEALDNKKHCKPQSSISMVKEVRFYISDSGWGWGIWREVFPCSVQCYISKQYSFVLAWVCVRLVAGIVDSNPAECMDVCLLCLYIVLSCVGRGFYDGLITRPEESYRVSNCACD